MKNNEVEDWEQAADLLHNLSFDGCKKMIEKIREKYDGKQTLAGLQLALDYFFAENELRVKKEQETK
jgi:adenylate cyclase class IV